MRYLGEHGSFLHVLAFSPFEGLQKAVSLDSNRHFWPDYYYTRGQMIDHKGKVTAVAVPLADWKDEYPDASILARNEL